MVQVIDTAALRSHLNDRIAQAERLKIVRHTEDNSSCEHEYQSFKQTVRPDSPRFDGMGAYFIVRACPKCQSKRVIDYVVER